MTNQQHFFKPLLPGFHSHLTIPVAFFLKKIEGRKEQKTAELRSDASNITWKVKIDGQRLTDGWKEFALAHDLRIGDILVFKQERDMTFHVTPFGPSCCEIQYGLCLDDQNNIGKKNVKKNPRREAESSLDPTCFVANVTPSSLRYDSLNLPMSFVRANGLDTRCGEMILMNEKGRSWTGDLKRKKSCVTTYIRRGWRSFCRANGLRAGNFSTFKLIQRGGTLVLRLSPTEPEEEDCSSESNEIDSDEDRNQDKRISQECTKRKEKKGKLIWKASSSPSQNRFVTVTLTPDNIRLSELVLPIPFTKVNGIKKAKKISLLDKHDVKWSTNLWYEMVSKRMRLVGGWKEFCDANGVKIGESIMLELIWEAERSFVLKFYSKIRLNRVEENKKRMEELNLNKLAQSLCVSSSPKPSPAKPRTLRTPVDFSEVRRSSFAKGPPPSYKEFGLEPLERPRRSYQRRGFLNRVYASDEARVYAIDKAEKLQSSLDTEFPSFIRPMLQSHVTGGFWLGLPHHFCKAHLPKRDEMMSLVDEEDEEFVVKYLAEKNGLSGGWRGFAIDHQLVVGDAVVFHLITPTMFKVYIIRVNGDAKNDSDGNEEDKENDIESNKKQDKNVSELRSSGKRKRGESDSNEDRNQDKRISQECTKGKEKKGKLIWKASSSPSQNRFVTVTLTPYNIRLSKLVLPIPFTKVNGIKNTKKISLLDKHGVKWSTNLRYEVVRKRMILVGGWKEFCDANGVKIGESIMLELICEADRGFVLKFYSKVMPQLK